jgi:hypothetical protein
LTVVEIGPKKFFFRMHDDDDTGIDFLDTSVGQMDSLDEAKGRAVKKAIEGHQFRDSPLRTEHVTADKLNWVEVEVDPKEFGLR